GTAGKRPARGHIPWQCGRHRPLPLDLGARLFLPLQPAHAHVAARPQLRVEAPDPAAPCPRGGDGVELPDRRRAFSAHEEAKDIPENPDGGAEMKSVRALVAAITMLAGAHAPAFAQDKLSVRLDFSPWGVQAAMHLAKNKGWFKDANLDIDVQDGRGSGN